MEQLFKQVVIQLVLSLTFQFSQKLFLQWSFNIYLQQVSH